MEKWYFKLRGINFGHSKEYGTYYLIFKYRDERNAAKKYFTVLSIIKSKERPEVKEKIFCINFQVNNLKKTVKHLKSLKIKVKGIDNYPEGKFA